MYNNGEEDVVWEQLLHVIDNVNVDVSCGDCRENTSVFAKLDKQRHVVDSQWKWLQQIDDLYQEELTEVSVSPTIDAVTLSVGWNSGKYTIKFIWVPDFPLNPPLYESTIKACFQLEWNSRSSLYSSYTNFCEVCSRFDEVLSECVNVTSPFLVEKWNVDDNEENCIRLFLLMTYIDQNYAAKEMRLEMSVNITDPYCFPRSVVCSKSDFLSSVKLDNWNTLESFDKNLHSAFIP